MTVKVCALISALAAIVALAAGVTVTPAAEPQTEAASAAVEYIKSLQNADGGFPAFGAESTPGSTIDALFALVAAGVGPDSVRNGGNSPLDYLETQAATYASDPGAAAKLALGVSVAGRDPGDFGGVDLLSTMSDGVDEGSGAYGLDLFDECFYILALVAAGEPVPEDVYQHLHSSRAEDGGWEFTPGSGSDSNTTAMVTQALVAAGAPDDDHAVGATLGYFRAIQNGDGGFGFAVDAETDPNSTALVIQAIAAAGASLDEDGRFAPNGNTPLEALLTFRNAETGALQYAGEDSAFATYQAVPALMLAPFPHLASVGDRAPTPAPSPVPDGASPTRAPTATPAVSGLPPAGGGRAGPGAGPWVLPAAILLAAGAIGASAALRLRKVH